MSFQRFLKDKIVYVLTMIVLLIFITMLGYAFKAVNAYIIVVDVLMLIASVLLLLRDFWKRKLFYDEFVGKLEQLDQKYLITEMVQNPEFYEGELLCEALYQINKSMKEKINDIERSSLDFREYLEMWIHEMKVPLSSLTLMNYNGETELSKQKRQIQKMNHYVEQMLFYARAGAPEKDYLLKKCDLEGMVNKVVRENKELLIGKKIAIEKENLAYTVITDSKWFAFILGQIINNSIKYVRDEERLIKFYAYKNQKDKKNQIVLVVEDHGIGICENDIGRIFEKSFTGQNGRKSAASTGMGLYICKKLCDKMGHNIWIASKENQYTRVFIAFGEDDYYLGM